MSETTQMTEITTEEAPRVVIFEEALEAVLFAAGHPITYSTLARVFELTPAVVKDKVFEYAIKYNDPSIPRGVILLTYKDSCQLCTKEHYLNEIRDALGIRKSGSLSTSSMEVLAIVAYNQPVTRAFVDTLRRVDSSYAMNNLLDRGLITATGRLDVPGRPMLYGTTSYNALSPRRYRRQLMVRRIPLPEQLRARQLSLELKNPYLQDVYLRCYGFRCW